MSIRNLLVHRMDVQKIPDTPARDSSGGIIDDPSQWTTVTAAVPCALNPDSAARMADFAIAGQQTDHTVITLQEGILVGQRLKVTDENGVVTYLRVATVKRTRHRGTIPAFTALACEEVRLQ